MLAGAGLMRLKDPAVYRKYSWGHVVELAVLWELGLVGMVER